VDEENFPCMVFKLNDDCYFYAEESRFKNTTIKEPALFELDEHVPSDDFEGQRLF